MEERYYKLEDIENLAYVAGIVDGEGSITITTNAAKRTFCSFIYVSNTDIRLMDWLHATYGGSVYTLPNQGDNHKTAFRWALFGKKAGGFIECIRPYLKIKCEQADIVIAFQNLRSAFHTRPSVPLSEEFIDQAVALKEAMLILNRQGTE